MQQLQQRMRCSGSLRHSTVPVWLWVLVLMLVLVLVLVLTNSNGSGVLVPTPTPTLTLTLWQLLMDLIGWGVGGRRLVTINKRQSLCFPLLGR
jgi:hypothetical protein